MVEKAQNRREESGRRRRPSSGGKSYIYHGQGLGFQAGRVRQGLVHEPFS